MYTDLTERQVMQGVATDYGPAEAFEETGVPDPFEAVSRTETVRRWLGELSCGAREVAARARLAAGQVCELAGQGMDELRWRYNQAHAALIERSQAAAAAHAEHGIKGRRAAWWLMGALVVDAAAYRMTGHGVGVLDSLTPGDAAALQDQADGVQAMGYGSGLQVAAVELAQVVPPVDVPPAADNPWVWNPIENWFEGQEYGSGGWQGGPVVCDPAASGDPAACAAPGPVVVPEAPDVPAPVLPEAQLPAATLPPTIPEVAPTLPHIEPLPASPAPAAPDVLPSPDPNLAPPAASGGYNYEQPGLSGKYLWNMMDNAGVPDGDIMPLLKEAASEASQHGHDVEWHGGGTHMWLEIDGQSDTKKLWTILKPYLNTTS